MKFLLILISLSVFANDIEKKLQKSVVQIELFDKDNKVRSIGSGFFIDRDKILTNFHTTSLNKNKKYEFSKIGIKSFQGYMAQTIEMKCGEGNMAEPHSLENIDLCLITVSGEILKGVKPLKLRESKIGKGQVVSVLGNCNGDFFYKELYLGDFHEEIRNIFSLDHQIKTKLKHSSYVLKKKNKDQVCEGDSGAPIVFNDEVVGVTLGAYQKTRKNFDNAGNETIEKLKNTEISIATVTINTFLNNLENLKVFNVSKEKILYKCFDKCSNKTNKKVDSNTKIQEQIPIQKPKKGSMLFE